MTEIKINTVVVSGKELNKGIFKQLDNVLCFYDQWKDEHPTCVGVIARRGGESGNAMLSESAKNCKPSHRSFSGAKSCQCK